jgi:hypothetical protein
MRNRRRLFAVTALVTVATAATALAAAQPTGNAQGIALARAVQRATDKRTVATFSETGFIALSDAEGRSSFFKWQWGSGTVPSGWTKAAESGTVVTKKGRIVWWRDALTPPRCTVAFCSQLPVVVLVEHAGNFYAFGTPSHHTCYGTVSGVPEHVGDPAYSVIGAFSAPVPQGQSVLLSYSYPWTKTQTANEIDTISSRTDLTQSGRTRVSGGGQPAFTIKFSQAYPAHTPSTPKINRCGK